ncbi:MAG: glycosyltransferase 87 family protein [Candidatus Thorarchaeota archaeon]
MYKTKIFFLVACAVNLFYLFLTFIFFYFLESPLMNINENDYLSFHYAGMNILQDLPNLYNSTLSPFPFRYLPIAAYFFTPFSLMGLEFGYFTFQIFNLFLNILTIYLFFKIIQIYKVSNDNSEISFNLQYFNDIFNKPENESILHHYAVFLIMLPQFMNYFLGQINLLVCVLILASLFYFLKDNVKSDILGGILLGLGISIRPTLILILPFLLILTYDKNTKKIKFNLKKSVLRILGSIILLIISGLYFLIYPQMLSDFVKVNLTGEYTYAIDSGIEINPSFSLTRIILIFLELIRVEINGFLIFIIITLLFFIPIYFYYIQNNYQPFKLINGFLAGILILLMVYFDSWPHHLLIIMPFLIFFILFNKKFKHHKWIKYLYYLMAILMVIFWGIFYLTYSFFPFNLGGLILLILLYSSLLLYFATTVR